MAPSGRPITLLEQEPEKYYMPNQYENPDNVLAHFETTGPEIYQQTNGEVDYFVAGMGTGGYADGYRELSKIEKTGCKDRWC